MFRMIEKHHFNGIDFDIEIHFTESRDMFGNYDIVRVTGSEGMATSNYMSQVVRDTYGRNQLQARMEDYVNNQSKKK
jgi:hypothetical protein